MKVLNVALYRAYFFIFYLAFILITPAVAADNVSELINTYQSSFDDYKPFTDESLADWKTINAQSNSNEHAGHSMAGTDHGSTKGVNDHKILHSATMPPMQEMNHDDAVGKSDGRAKYHHGDEQGGSHEHQY